MSVKKLKQSLGRLQDALVKRSYYADKDKRGLKLQNYNSQIKTNITFIEEHLWDVARDIDDRETRLELFVLLHNLKLTRDIRAMLMICSRMDTIIKEVKGSGSLNFSIANLPMDVREELLADLDELKRCYNAKCYRSCVIICGRILEIALHRKYYEKTGQDVLEKSPGIGLGNLIKKMIDKDIKLDPGLTQQIHLINNVRVFSVHKKQQPFKPSKAQTHAIILFSLDTLEKLF